MSRRPGPAKIALIVLAVIAWTLLTSIFIWGVITTAPP